MIVAGLNIYRPRMGVAWIWICFCCLAGRSAGAAVEPEFLTTSWDVENGLPDSTVRDVLQTHDGYLWVSTANGLARFDGVRFTVFNSLNTPELRSNDFHRLLQDDENGLWIGTANGVMRYRVGRFERAGQGQPWATNRWALVFKDAAGGIWMRSRSGPESIRFQEGKYTLFARPTRWTNEPAAIQATDSLGRAWNGTAADMRHGVQFNPLRLSNGAPAGTVGMLATPSSDGGLWLVSSSHLRKVKDGQLMFDTIPFSSPGSLLRSAITSIFEDSSGCLWLGTAGAGVYRLAQGGKVALLNSIDPPVQQPITCFFEDREGTLWIGTDGGGLVQAKRRRVTTLLVPTPQQDYIFTSTCAGRDGNLWAGTDGGGVFSYRDGKLTRLAEESGLGDLHVFTVYEDSRSNLWVGTTSGLYVRREGKFLPVGRPGTIGRWVYSLFEDHSGALWVGCFGKLCRVQGEQIEIFTEPAGPLPRCDVRAFAEDAHGTLWVGTAQSGLIQIRNGQATHYGPERGLDEKGIRTLLADADGTLWIGTLTKGLYRFRQGKFTHYSTADGLPDDHIQSLL
ncbi:MAG: hypothetical protein NT154_24545, partial [Verrucomicrobia bacterium]|nr:hypothetical protein [Verrucomicrobiota bacterium]